MRPSWCFPLAECSQKQMDYGRSFKMRNRSLSLIVVLVTVSIVTYRPVLAQGPATVEPIQRGVPCEGPENRSDVGRRRRQARRHVERYITRTANAGADPRNASQGYEADAGGRLWISPGPGRRDD